MGNREVLDGLVRQRFEETKVQRSNTRKDVFRREPLAAEPDQLRAKRYIYRHRAGAESLRGDTVDYLPSWFLQAGAERARAVAVVRAAGNAQGTGFLISPRLFITNNHVLEHRSDAAQFSIAFNYEVDEAERLEVPTVFKLDPTMFWLTNPVDNLDFTIVAVGERIEGSRELAEFGYLPLSDRPDKHALGMCVNIVQHPLGKRKQVVVRENRLLARGAARRTLHYSADTEDGSSGSPVFNDGWEVVALHHWGVPHLDTVTIDGDEIPQTVNEGVRASAIVAELKADVAGLASDQRSLLEQALTLGETAFGALRPPSEHPLTPSGSSGGAGTATEFHHTIPGNQEANMPSTPDFVQVINVPLEVRVRVAGIASSGSTAVTAVRPAGSTGTGAFFQGYAEKLVIDPDYSNRNGYNASFIEGLNLPLAQVVHPRISEVAPLRSGAVGAKATLDYQNFSVVVCADRKMAFVSAANIDAERYINIDRDTGLPKVGPEGESWSDDPRMDPKYYVGQDFYGTWSKYFDRGHLTRRSDPTWGTEQEAVRGNADTFHRTNCTPQHWRFNQSIKYWQGVERYVLEFGALKDKLKVSVLTGPVLDDQVQDYDGLAVPLRFWKLVLRVGKSGLVQATALVVDQRNLLSELRKGMTPGGDGTPPNVDEYRVSVAYLEGATGLDFSAVRQFDTFKGAAGDGAEAAAVRVITDWSDLL